MKASIIDQLRNTSPENHPTSIIMIFEQLSHELGVTFGDKARECWIHPITLQTLENEFNVSCMYPISIQHNPAVSTAFSA